MNAPRPLPAHHQALLDRFVAACRVDERVSAALLYGSHASGLADMHSDLDLGLITTDLAFDDFMAGREDFMRGLGEVLFLETFDIPDVLFFVYADGVEGELALGSVSNFQPAFSGPVRVLLDKHGTLAEAEFALPPTDPDEQVERLRRLVMWFWHDLSHFITALGRRQWWWAYGQLEALRRMALDLAHLRHDFAIEAEGYDKVDQYLPAAYLAPLGDTLSPQGPEAMLRAARAVVAYYQELARPLAQEHGILYPVELERLLLQRLQGVSGGGES
jgi:predicted nucleotidyltransferase